MIKFTPATYSEEIKLYFANTLSRMSKYTKLLYDTAIFAVGSFTTKLIYFFLMPIYTVALTTYDFGLADLLNNSLQLIIPIFTLCIPDAIFRFSLDKDADFRALLSNGLNIIFSGILLVCGIIGIVYVYNPQSYWFIFALLFFTESLKTLFAQFTRGIGNVKTYAVNGIIAAIVLLILSFIFLRILKWGINGYLLAFVLANTTSIMYLLFVADVRKYISITKGNKLLVKGMLSFSLPLIPNMLSWWLTNISSRYIIAGFCGLSASGLFSAASKLPALINVIASVFQLSWQFASVKEYQESDKSDFYSTVFRFYSFIIIVAGSLILSFIPYISRFLLKGDFYDAWSYTPLLLFSAILGCYSIFFGTFYSVVKDNKKAMYTTLTGSIVSVILCFCLIPFIGVVGALIANVLSYIVIVVMRVNDCKRIILLKANWKVIIVSLTLLLIQSVLLTIDSKTAFYIALCMPVLFCIIYWNCFSQLYSYIKNIILKIK